MKGHGVLLTRSPICSLNSTPHTLAPTVSGHPPSGGWTNQMPLGYVISVEFDPSGDRLVVTGNDGLVKILDASNGKKVLTRDQHLEPFASIILDNSAVFSPDGKRIASPQGKRGVELWDVANGATICRFKDPEKSPKQESDNCRDSTPAAFSPDGRLLAVEFSEIGSETVVLFDVSTGASRLSLPTERKHGVRKSDPGKRVAFTPDGAILATASLSENIVLWDLKTGKKLRELVGHSDPVVAISISADGRMLASCASKRYSSSQWGDHTIRLWDVQTGRPLATIAGGGAAFRSVIFSPDGRTLLSGGEGKTIHLWETATGKQLLRWNMDDGINQVAISPDGKKVAAALMGGVTLFPIDPPQPDKLRPTVDDRAFEGLWTDLGGQDAEQAYRAVRSLSQASEDIPARIGKRLKPADSIVRWIADLDNDDFDRREAASKQLAALGPQAEPGLRKALDETKSAEVRSRIQPLLKALGEWVVTDPDTLRSLRAIWVLERIGTPEARAVLEDLAKGAPEARQTQEAKSAIVFLDKRAAAVKP
jgi:WD40 repeat protein